MANTHNDVARKFSQRTPASGSRMSCYARGDWLDPHRVFHEQMIGVSYRTTVCKVVRNTHTNKQELWVTPVRYSTSTDRHVAKFTSAFLSHYAKTNNCDYETARAQVFTTPAADGGARYNPENATRLLDILPERLQEVDKPRLRDATRRGLLEALKTRLEYVIRRMTQDVPMDVVDAKTLYAAQDALGFIEGAMSLTDIAEVRVAVRAYVALTKD